MLTDKFETLSYDIGQRWVEEFLKGPTFLLFFEGKIKGDLPGKIVLY